MKKRRMLPPLLFLKPERADDIIITRNRYLQKESGE